MKCSKFLLVLLCVVLFSATNANVIFGADTTNPSKVTEQKMAPKQKCNVNKASIDELIEVPGIGPKTAEAIIAYREDHGKFKTLDDLMEVKGIGEKKLKKLSPFIKV